LFAGLRVPEPKAYMKALAFALKSAIYCSFLLLVMAVRSYGLSKILRG
jgi:hypothetical protein